MSPRVVSLDEFLAERGAGASERGDSGLHSPAAHVAARTRQDQVDRQRARDFELDARRTALREEYYQAIKSGEIRAPTRREMLERTAAGHPDNPSVQAARRLLGKTRSHP